MDDADRMRDRLRELGRAGHQLPSAALEARIVERVKAAGPAAIRRSHQRRAWSRAGAIALPIALGAAWVSWRSLDVRRDDVARSAGTGRAPNAELAATRTAECAERARPVVTGFSALPGGRRWIDLGERGRIVLERGGEARLEATNPCKLQLRLAAGRVSVHAANLFGGELRVSAGSTEVVVHGTTFAVERANEAVTVDVDEGAVGVETAHSPQAVGVRAGQQLKIDRVQAPIVAALSDQSRLQLRAALASVRVPAPDEVAIAASPAQPSAAADHSASPAAPKPMAASAPSSALPAQPTSQASPARLVARADALWSDGARDNARARYREAGAATGPTAEAAWLALARRELSIGRAAAARTALASYAARFPKGELAGEAAGIEFRAALLDKDDVLATRLARRLVERYPGIPQAEAAARWLQQHGARR